VCLFQVHERYEGIRKDAVDVTSEMSVVGTPTKEKRTIKLEKSPSKKLKLDDVDDDDDDDKPFSFDTTN